MSRHFNARSTRTNVSDEDDTTASSLGEGFLHDDDEEEEHVNVGADGKWDESLAKLRYTMVAFELFDKSQMKRFFGTVWALIGVAAVYVMVFLSHAAVCSANATFPEAFEKYVQAECSRNGTIPGNFSAPEFWSFCCSPFDGIGHAGPGGCFDAPEVEQRDYAHPPPTYMGCCHVDLEGALDVCDSHCQFSLVDAVARTLLGTASVVGLFVYGARFCISPNMRRFEQKFVLGLFFLCVLMTNPVSAGFLLTQRYNIDVFGSCGTARYETPSASQKAIDEIGRHIQSIGCTIFAATTFGFGIVFLMGYRTSTKLGSTWDTCWRTRRSLGPRYVGVGLLLGIYITSRVVLGVLNSPSFAAVTLGCVPMLPPLLSLLRMCVAEQVPDFAVFYLNLLNSSGVPNGHDYIGTCKSRPGTLVFIAFILLMDVALTWLFINETKRTQRTLLSFGYAQSRTLQVTYRFFMSHTVTVIGALQVLGLAYALFLPPVFFWHSTDVRPDGILPDRRSANLTNYGPLFQLGATGGGGLGDSTIMSFLACLWTFSLAFSYLPETAKPGLFGCCCDVKGYSRDHGAGIDKSSDEQGFRRAKNKQVGRPVYKHSVAEAERSYFWARENLRVGQVFPHTPRQGLHNPGVPARDRTRVVNIDDHLGSGDRNSSAAPNAPAGATNSPGATNGRSTTDDVAPDRENVFVFETQFVLCVFAALAYECTIPPYFMPPLPPLPEAATRRLSQGPNAFFVPAPPKGGDSPVDAAETASAAAGIETQDPLGPIAARLSAGSSGGGGGTGNPTTSVAGAAVVVDSDAGNTARMAAMFETVEEQAAREAGAVDGGYAKGPRRFITKAQWVVQHTETDACCFIAQDTVDKCYIVSFRGTSTATNAMDDLKMNLVPFTMMEHISAQRRQNYHNVFVHAGFQRVYLSIREELVAKLSSLLSTRRLKIRVTGHSLGGALATLFAFDAVTRLCHPRSLSVTTFGSPRVGNRNFAHMFRDHVRCAWRVANQFDGVTRVPQACLGGSLGPYVHVGKFVLVFANGDVVIDPSVIEKNFLHEFRIDYYRHKCGAYLIGLLNWNHRVHADALKVSARKAQMRARRRKTQELMMSSSLSSTSSSSVLSSMGSINGSPRPIHAHRQRSDLKARVTTAICEQEDDELSLSQPLQARDFTLTPSANASVDGQSSESGFDAGSEGGATGSRGGGGGGGRAEGGGARAGAGAGGGGGSGSTMFKIEKYIWASNTLREDYDSVGLKGMETMYFVEPQVASLLERCFGKRRIQPRLSTTSTTAQVQA